MATRAIRVLKSEWKLLASNAATIQVEGENVEAYVTVSATRPSEAPDANKADTPAVRTVRGDLPYVFNPVGDLSLWAYPKDNGAVILVDETAGSSLKTETAFSTRTAFGELKTAEYHMLTGWLFPYNINSELLIQTTANDGSIAHSGSFAVLHTGTEVDGSAVLETRKALRYQTGIGALARFTAIFSEGVADSSQWIGLGCNDQNDALYFGFNGATFGILRRANGTDNFTALASWSEGVFDGFDPTKLNVYQIQFQWLGGGELRFYIEDPAVGGFVLVHRIMFANSAEDVSLRNPSLPLRAEVTNAGNDTDITLSTPSASGGLEGKADLPALQITRGVSSVVTGVTTTELPLLSIRNPSTYKTIPNRLTLQAILASIAITSATLTRVATVKLYRGASLTGASFAAVDADATPAELDTAASAVSGGTQLFSITTNANNSILAPLKDADITIRPGEVLTVTGVATGAVDIATAITFHSEV